MLHTSNSISMALASSYVYDHFLGFLLSTLKANKSHRPKNESIISFWFKRGGGRDFNGREEREEKTYDEIPCLVERREGEGVSLFLFGSLGKMMAFNIGEVLINVLRLYK